MQFGFNNNCRWGFTFRVMQKTKLVSESSKFVILFLVLPLSPTQTYNLGQNKMEQQISIPAK